MTLPDGDLGHSDTSFFPSLLLIFLSPHPARVPIWARLAGQEYTHAVAMIGDHIWDQPIDEKGACYSAEEWLDAADVAERDAVFVILPGRDADPEATLRAFRKVAGRRGQRIRTMLRFLRLWPFRPWNCTSPIRILADAYGVPLTGETPDDLIEEVTRILLSTERDPRNVPTGS